MDDYGTEKILLILEQEDVISVKCNANGNISDWETLYPVSTTPKQVSKTLLVGSYKIYNDLSEEKAETTATTATTETTTTTATVTNHDALSEEQAKALAELAMGHSENLNEHGLPF